MHLYHLTDIHLNFLSPTDLKVFINHVVRTVGSGNALVITGDIAEAHTVDVHMEEWKKILDAAGIGFWFVCGNHDYYHGSIEKVRESLREGALKGHWLPSAGPIKLTDKTWLVGHDGWYDGLYGNWFASNVTMSDYKIIREFMFETPKFMLFDKIQKFSQEGGDFVYHTGTQVFRDNTKCEELFIATHVPPFREASIHNGKISDPDWLPHFSSKRMGDSILQLAEENPTKNITVLCGHSHSHGICNPTKNVTCYTGKAHYGYPCVGDKFAL